MTLDRDLCLELSLYDIRKLSSVLTPEQHLNLKIFVGRCGQLRREEDRKTFRTEYGSHLILANNSTNSRPLQEL